MNGVHPSQYESSRQSTGFQAPYWRHRIAQQWPETGRTRFCLILWLAMVLITSLCLVSPGQAQVPPETAFRIAIYGPNFDGDPQQSICGRLNFTPPSVFLSGTADLLARCNELAPSQPSEALRQVAAEEAAAQGTQGIEVSNRNIGARLAALRSVVRGIGPQRIALQRQGPMLHGTLVASLSPTAALSGTEAAQTPPFSRFGIFANGTFSTGDKDVTPNEPGFDFNTYGGTAGVDYRFTTSFVLGAAFSYQATDADLDDTTSIGIPGRTTGGGVDTKGYIGSIYGTYYISNRLYIDGIISFGWNDYEIDRPIVYTVGTGVNQVAHGDTDGTQFSFSFGAGYDFNTGGFTVGPFARVNYIRLDIDGYQEEIGNTNPGFGWALEFDSQDVESLTSVLGVQASYAISTGLGVLLPQVRFEWEHEFKDNSRTIIARFVNDPVRAPIPFSTDDPDRDFFNIGVGLSATFRGGVSAFVYYETVLGLEDITRHSVTIGVRKEL